MKLFLWSSVKKCTSNYHSEGGVVAIAESGEMAVALALMAGCEIAPDELPDAVYDVEGSEVVWLFPDAGCC